jgi:hypothetical protein
MTPERTKALPVTDGNSILYPGSQSMLIKTGESRGDPQVARVAALESAHPPGELPLAPTNRGRRTAYYRGAETILIGGSNVIG